MNLKVGDKVVVIAGSDKGKEGKIIKTIRCENRVVVEFLPCSCYYEQVEKGIAEYTFD